MTVFFVASMTGAIAGGYWPWVVFFLAMLMMTAGDELIGNSRKMFSNFRPELMNFLLLSTLPFLALLSVIMATVLGNGDPFGLIYAIHQLTGLDLAIVRATATRSDLIGSVVLIGLLYGTAGINVAHELFHRVSNPASVVTARWLLAFSWDTTFAIEHVHGHHIHVATAQDAATAKRGDYIGIFIVRSTVQQFIKAFQIEAKRLTRKSIPAWRWHNRALRGQFMSLLITGLFYYAAGWTGVAAHICMAVIGKGFLESVNYIEHYGLVRVPGTRVGPRHSWDCYKIMSNAVLYNLPRHSAHHENAAKRFWELEAKHLEAPQMPYGYMSMIIIAFFPPWWHSIMKPLLRKWDAEFATDDERTLLGEQ